MYICMCTNSSLLIIRKESYLITLLSDGNNNMTRRITRHLMENMENEDLKTNYKPVLKTNDTTKTFSHNETNSIHQTNVSDHIT